LDLVLFKNLRHNVNSKAFSCESTSVGLPRRLGLSIPLRP